MRMKTQLILLGVIGYASVNCCETTSMTADGTTQLCELCYTSKGAFKCTYVVTCDQNKLSNCTASRTVINTKEQCNQKCCSLGKNNAYLFDIVCNDSLATGSTNYIIAALITFLVIVILFTIGIVYYKYCRNREQRKRKINLAEEDKVELNKFKLQDVGKPFLNLKESCSICLEDHNNVGTQCSHCFHFKCLKAWSNKNYSCPYCKSVKINPIKQYCISCGSGMRLLTIKEQTSFQGKDKECKTCAEQILQTSAPLNRKQFQNKSNLNKPIIDPFLIDFDEGTQQQFPKKEGNQQAVIPTILPESSNIGSTTKLVNSTQGSKPVIPQMNFEQNRQINTNPA